MKTLVIIIGVLAVTAVVYSLDTERSRMFTENLAKCKEELGVAEANSAAIKCALTKDGRIFNANGEYIKEEAIKALGDIISNAANLEKAREIFTTCYDEVVSSGTTGDEQTIKIITCGMPIMSLLDKP